MSIPSLYVTSSLPPSFKASVSSQNPHHQYSTQTKSTMHPFAFSLFLTICFLLSQPLGATADAATSVPAGTIQRVTKQQILAAIPPHSEENVTPFLTSPSGKFVACLIRHGTAPGAGGFGNDFCFVQVEMPRSLLKKY